LRDHLLQVAIDMLEKEGVAGFTTRNVARGAETSTPAVYELFGDKAGLVREVFFEGFRVLRRQLDRLDESDDPRADLLALAQLFRRFARENPVLADVMFRQPFADFDPAPSDVEAGSAVREFVMGQVRRAIDAGVLVADATDAAQVLMAVTLGLAGAENASRLGTSVASVDRRWALGVEAVLDGLGPAHRGRPPPRGGTRTAASRPRSPRPKAPKTR
jgi:AcrR family transcriptional regulator